MGKQADLGSPNSKIIKISALHDSKEGAIFPKLVSNEVTCESSEFWSEGVSIFHNPNALFPIDRNLFPRVAHHYLIDDELVSYLPNVFPYFSMNSNVISR